MNKHIKYISHIAGAFLLAAGVSGCVDDVLIDNSGPGSMYEIAEDEYALGFNISLSQLTGSTRSQIGGALGDLGANGLKDIEEYVNTENLYILFFNLDGTFLFQINKPVAIPIGQSQLGNDNQWFIKIPVKEINENLIHYIEENPFKIAVLANWTFDADINLGENLSGWDEFKFNEPLDAEGNLIYDENGKLKGDHISLLAHAQRDNVYENTTLHGYDHLVYRTETGPHMGPYTEWVKNYHKSIDEADADIRANFDVKANIYRNPDSKYTDNAGNPNAINNFTMDYNNIWQVWNFGGADDSDFILNMKGAQASSQIAQDWLNLNQKAKDYFVDNYIWQYFYYQSPYDYNYPMKWKLDNYSDLDIYGCAGYGICPNYNVPMDAFPTQDQMSEMTEAEYKAAMKNVLSQFNGLVITYPNITFKDNADGNPLNLVTNVNSQPNIDGGGISGSNGSKLPTTSPTYIHFKAYADGYLRINYKTRGGAKLYAHVGTNNTPQNNASGYQKSNQSNRYEVNEDGFLVKSANGSKQICDIPFEPKDVYLYMVVDPEYKTPEPDYEYDEDGNIIGDGSGSVGSAQIAGAPGVTIYGIEYIESRHLYDADRHAVLPTKEYPIPMYGIQDFDPIGEYWEPGVLFNLSQFNNAQKEGYSYRNISLLRSLARVEVKLLKSAFKQKPSHVFMRSMNRSARMTPVDFFTPTDIVWYGFNPSKASDVKRLQNYINIGNLNEQEIIRNTPGVAKEHDNIMKYGPIYIGQNANSGQSDKQKLDEYRKTTAWPFGIWEQQWGWDWNRGTSNVDWFDTYKVGDTRAHTGQAVPEYPRILHTRISRSDYCRFTEVEDNDYWHYIMYIPEKNITDADNPGDISDRPKIIHVELRFNGGPDDGDTSNDEDNYVDNFDDKAAYRLYFTEGGRANLGNFNFTGRDSWDNYEYDWNIVKQHWPILRNHVYTFTVNGKLDQYGSIKFEADAPDQRLGEWVFE